jgi:hypothetical protein
MEFVGSWFVALCSVMVVYQHYGGLCYPQLQGWVAQLHRRENLKSSTSTLKMEAVQCSETLVSNHTTQCNNPGNPRNVCFIVFRGIFTKYKDGQSKSCSYSSHLFFVPCKDLQVELFWNKTDKVWREVHVKCYTIPTKTNVKVVR